MNLGLQIQTLGGFRDQTLVLTHVASAQADSEGATPADVLAIYRKLRLPPTSNVGRDLARLQAAGHVMQPEGGRWAPSPLGVDRIRQLMAGISDDDLKKLLTLGTGEATFGEGFHHLIPPEFAPADFQQGIGRFLEGHPFERNVFGMTRFPGHSEKPLSEAIDACRWACSDAGLEFHLASDRTVADLLLGNVAAAMWASKYGIALFEDRIDRGLNYNAIFEVGSMLVTGRRCLLLRDRTSPDLPTDLVGRIYTRVDFDDADSSFKAVGSWAHDTLGLS